MRSANGSHAGSTLACLLRRVLHTSSNSELRTMFVTAGHVLFACLAAGRAGCTDGQPRGARYEVWGAQNQANKIKTKDSNLHHVYHSESSLPLRVTTH